MWSDWHDVEQRLDDLAGSSAQTLSAFVVEVLEAGRAPVVVASLARHPDSAATVRTWLRDLIAGPAAALRTRTTYGETYAAALTAAARLLLPPDGAQAAVDAIEAQRPQTSSHYFQFLDASTGVRPAGGVAGPPTGVRHRLIVTEKLDDPQMVALLLPGCERATVLAVGDLFGRADLAGRAGWTGSGDVGIEHIRSRITRYSAEYIGLHLATADLAERLASQVESIPGLLHRHDRPSLALELADALFFRALRIRALDLILADGNFDDIVVSVGEQTPATEFVRQLAGLERIRTDPRVQLVSAGRTVEVRTAFWSVLDAIVSPAAVPAPLLPGYSMPTVVAQFAAAAAARTLDVTPPPDGPWVLLGTGSKDAYIESTVTSAREIARDLPVRVLHVDSGAAPPNPALAALGTGSDAGFDAGFDIGFGSYPVEPVRGTPVADAIRRYLQPQCAAALAAAATPFEGAAARALTVGLASLCSAVVVPALLRAKVFEQAFSSWRDRSRLPSALVLIPQRPGDIGVLAAIARRFGVPSIAVEPHLYVPEYSRYTKVVTDYYGVLSTYLVAGAVEQFGLGDPERVRVVGSARLVAPPGYDPTAARTRARAAYTAATGFDFSRAATHLVFFCQPSGWQHVEPVWNLLLDAVGSAGGTSGVHLFFKAHPEEGPARVQQYLDLAARRGLSASVTRLSGDAAEAIALADVAATSYSTAALDAAIRTTPVVGVAPGGSPYPVDVAAVAGARVATTAEELTAWLDEFAADPAARQRDAQAWLQRERQFVEGPGPALRRLVADAIARGPAGIRPLADVPGSVFTDGPHPVLQV